MNRSTMGRLASLFGVRPRASGLRASVPSVGDAAGIGALDIGPATVAVDVLGTVAPTPAAVVEAIAAAANARPPSPATPLSETERLERWYVEDQVRRAEEFRTKVETSARLETNEVIRAVSDAAATARQRAAAQLSASAPAAVPRASAPVAAAPAAVAPAPAPVAPVAAYVPPSPRAPTHTPEQRVAAILSHPAAFGRQHLAEHLAYNSPATVAEAIGILGASARDEVLVAAYHGAAGERAARGMALNPARDLALAKGISAFLAQPLLVDTSAPAASEAEEYARGAAAARTLFGK